MFTLAKLFIFAMFREFVMTGNIVQIGSDSCPSTFITLDPYAERSTFLFSVLLLVKLKSESFVFVILISSFQ
jgi:hypothetical protein